MAGASFVKTWRIQNDGNRTWDPGFPLHSLAFAGGTNLADAFTIQPPTQAGPCAQVDVYIPLKAAIYPGRYISECKLKVDNGPLAGFRGGGYAPIYVQIVVRGDRGSSGGICSYYIGLPGDWLGLIAMRYGTTWQAIAQANGLYNPNWIYAGMRLAIPCGNGQNPPSGQREPCTGSRGRGWRRISWGSQVRRRGSPLARDPQSPCRDHRVADKKGAARVRVDHFEQGSGLESNG